MLELTLPVVGSDRDTWGDKLNAALEAMRDAINARPDPAATKVVPHQVTGPVVSGSYVDIATTPEGTARYPVALAAPVSRFRVHIRNYSYADGTGYTGTVNLTGLWWGEGNYNLDSALDGTFKAAPTQVQGAAAINGSTEWVSGWIDVNATKGTDYILSIGWSTVGVTGAATRIVSNWTRHWRTTSAANASQQAPTLTGQAGPNAPFDVWLECEIPAATPVVAFVGDSITVGDMHGSSFPRRYGLTHDVWPAVYAAVGARLQDWGSGSLDRWTRYGTVNADAIVLLCGVNDIQTDATLNDTKFRTNAVVTRIRTYLGKRIFAGTILPVNNTTNMTTARNTVRENYNAWITFPRNGVLAAFDLAKAVASTTNSAQMVAAYTWDGLHLSELGSAQVANAIPHLTRG